MRIIAGKYRGKSLLAPAPEITRPTSDRAREAVFSVIESMLMRTGKTWKEINFIDAFAGSGACGIEALSRGAKYVVFCEKDKSAVECIKKNLNAVNASDYADIVGDVLNLSKAKAPFDVVFTDAPYGKNLSAEALKVLALKGWIADKTMCIVETEVKELFTAPEGFALKDVKKYGRAQMNFLVWENRQ